jgi:hypothetical protein
MPELRARFAIDGVGVVPRSRQIHDSIDHERRAFETVENARLKGPDRDQSRDVLGIDLVQGTVAMPAVRAAVHQPVGVIGSRPEQIVFIDRPDWLGRGLLSFGGRLDCAQLPSPGKDQPRHETQCCQRTKAARLPACESSERQIQCAHSRYLAFLRRHLRKIEIARPQNLEVSLGAFRSVVEIGFARRTRVDGRPSHALIILGTPGQSRNSTSVASAG